MGQNDFAQEFIDKLKEGAFDDPEPAWHRPFTEQDMERKLKEYESFLDHFGHYFSEGNDSYQNNQEKIGPNSTLRYQEDLQCDFKGKRGSQEKQSYRTYP